eukprot:52737-Prymnesium_polylepis.1
MLRSNEVVCTSISSSAPWTSAVSTAAPGSTKLALLPHERELPPSLDASARSDRSWMPAVSSVKASPATLPTRLFVAMSDALSLTWSATSAWNASCSGATDAALCATPVAFVESVSFWPIGRLELVTTGGVFSSVADSEPPNIVRTRSAAEDSPPPPPLEP